MSSITDELRRIIENTAIMDEDTGSEWSVISKRMALALADAIDRDHERLMEQQNHDLIKASIEYLRKENIDWEDKYRELAGRYNRLGDLALMLHRCALGMADCDMCRRSNDGYACEYIMRELGVEVS